MRCTLLTFLMIMLSVLLSSCATRLKGGQLTGDPGSFTTLYSGYMPDWSATQFSEAGATASGVLSRPYRDAVLDARRHDRRALEEVL